MFSGESVSSSYAYTLVSYFLAVAGAETVRWDIEMVPPVTSLILRSDKSDLESVLLSNGSQPQSDEESARRTRSSYRKRTTPEFL